MRLLRDDRGQDAFEYLLVLGTLVVALVIGFMAFDAMVGQVVAHSCPSVDTVVSTTAGQCIETATPAP